MKRIKLILYIILSSLLGTIAYGQDISVTDFEGTAPNTGGWNHTYALINNTLAGTGNSSAKIGSVTTSSQYPAFQINTSSFVSASNPVLSFLIYSSVTVPSISGVGRTISVQLNGTGVPSIKAKFGISADQVNTWVPISLDFSLFPSGTYNQIQFNIIGANGTDLHTYYLDDIKLKVPASTPTKVSLYYEAFGAGNGNDYTPGSGDASTFTGWNSLGTVTGLNITTNWPDNYPSDPAASDGFGLNLLNANSTTSPFTLTAKVLDKPNLFVKFGIFWKTTTTIGTNWRPNIDVNIDNSGWVPLRTITGSGLYPTAGMTWGDVTIPLLDASGTPLPAGDLLQIRIQNSPFADYIIDDLYILQDITPPVATVSGGPTKVPVTVYYEPFNLGVTSETITTTSALTGFASGATIGGSIVTDATNGYFKSYPFTTQGADDFIGFFSESNKITDLTFTGINIADVSDLALSFGLAQRYMGGASNLPKIAISIDGQPWLPLTQASNGTSWGTTFFDNTFTGVTLPIVYGSTPLKGNLLSIHIWGSNGGQMDDIKITGTTIAGVPTTTPGISVLYYEPFNLTQAYDPEIPDASTVAGFATGATVTGILAANAINGDYVKNYSFTTATTDYFISFWGGTKFADLTFSGINIANKVNLGLSFGLAQQYMTLSSKPDVYIRVDGGAWTQLTQTGNGTAWGVTFFDKTFTGVYLPIALTGNKLDINIKGISNGGQLDDLKVTGETPDPNAGNKSVTGITVSAASQSVITGNTLQMTATVLPANATKKVVTWSVNNIGGSGTISSTGLFTANGLGTVNITATATDGSGVSGSLIVTITGLPVQVVQSIRISKQPETAISAHVGEPLQMVVNVLPTTAVDKSVTWSVVEIVRGIKDGNSLPNNGKGEAEIDSETGILIGITPGPINVVAVTNDGSEITDTLRVLISKTSEITEVNELEFSIYPNPATNQFRISNALDIKDVAVYDLIGSPVAVAYSNGNVNISGIASGTYFVKITTLDGKTIVRRILKH